MYKKIISIITLVTTTFAKCPIDVTLPDQKKVTIHDNDNSIINQLRSSPLASASSQGGAQEIANKIDPKTDVGETVMDSIAEYVPRTTMTNYSVVKTVLDAVSAQTGTNLQIGAITECTQLGDTVRSYSMNDPIIINKIRYHDYSVYRGIVNAGCVVNEIEKEIIVKSTLRSASVDLEFDTGKYIIQCTVHCGPIPNYENRDIRELLLSEQYLHDYNMIDQIRLYIRFDPDNRPTQFVRWGKIQNNELKDKYPVFQTIALIIRAADLVKDTDHETPNCEAFMKSLSSQLSSFKFPNIQLCANTQKYT
jgi:hypothetical protein